LALGTSKELFVQAHRRKIESGDEKTRYQSEVMIREARQGNEQTRLPE